MVRRKKLKPSFYMKRSSDRRSEISNVFIENTSIILLLLYHYNYNRYSVYIQNVSR